MLKEQNTNDQTTRALLAMRSDVAALTRAAERVRVHYEALAGRHGIGPEPDESMPVFAIVKITVDDHKRRP